MSTGNKTMADIVSEKAAAIDKAFERFEAYLNGTKPTETEQVLALKRIIGNYSIQNNICYSQAERLFHVQRGTTLHTAVSGKITGWLATLVNPFRRYEAKKKIPVADPPTQHKSVISTGVVLGKQQEFYPAVELEKQIEENNLHRGSYFEADLEEND